MFNKRQSMPISPDTPPGTTVYDDDSNESLKGIPFTLERVNTDGKTAQVSNFTHPVSLEDLSLEPTDPERETR